MVVFAKDECHLLWGDTTGYVWGRRNERTETPIENVRKRQTYYGALNLYNQNFVLTPNEQGNEDNTILFLQYLQAINKDKQLIIIWDGASYHRSQKVKDYLKKVNQDLEEKNWKITCFYFAPNAPDQNPVEDVWLRGKDFLRKHFYNNKSFQDVKRHFFNFLIKKTFNFSKPEWYLVITQPV